jgi:hypothetical protein
MNDTLIYTDARPRAKSTGHAFGFEGSLGLPVIIAAMFSVFLLTMLFSGNNQAPIPLKFLVSFAPTVLTAGYIILFRNRRPPRFDLDLLASWVNGQSFSPAKLQPRHPFFSPE